MNPATLARDILDGYSTAATAMGRTDMYDYLNAGKSASTGGILPMLGTSSKIEAGGSHGVLSTVLYMEPAMVSGREACPGRSDGCTAACLAESVGRMSMGTAQRARRRRHASFYSDRARFLTQLAREVALHEARARKQGKTPAVRLNGTTDLPWHRMPVVHNGVKYPNVHAIFPNVHFYEYTKRPLGKQGKVPANLHLTFSLSDHPESDVRALHYLEAGHNVAAVTFTERHVIPASFTLTRSHPTRPLPVTFPTVDGDAHDARFLDPVGHVVILAAKGRAKHDTTGFVRYPTALPLALAA